MTAPGPQQPRADSLHPCQSILFRALGDLQPTMVAVLQADVRAPWLAARPYRAQGHSGAGWFPLFHMPAMVSGVLNHDVWNDSMFSMDEKKPESVATINAGNAR
jgi:hypothetical protein